MTAMADKPAVAPKGAREQAAGADAAAELEVLFPDRDVTVRDPDTGEAVALTVREFRFREGLEATALARPLIAALAALVPADAAAAASDAAKVARNARGEDCESTRNARGEDCESTRNARGEDAPDTLAVEATLAAHAALWLALAARACGKDAAWLARLGDADGRALSEAMWAANGGFFLRRVVAVVTRMAAQGRGAHPFRSTACSTPSSAPATDAATSTSASA